MAYPRLSPWPSVRLSWPCFHGPPYDPGRSDFPRLVLAWALQLGVESRHKGVGLIGVRVADLKKIVEHLMSDDQLEPVRMFLGKILERVENAVGEAYKRLQLVGREVFKTDLQREFEFWNRCDHRWGKGQSYHTAIRDHTAEQFEGHYEDAHVRIKQITNGEWDKIVQLLDEMIKDGGGQLAGSSLWPSGD